MLPADTVGWIDRWMDGSLVGLHRGDDARVDGSVRCSDPIDEILLEQVAEPD